VLAGLCLRWDAPQALILVPVFAWVIARRFIDGEEARLRDAFGAEFDSWAARVGRWF
jgi:protein-S-isoprenylcysteine O-methyltransferase Ste14